MNYFLKHQVHVFIDEKTEKMLTLHISSSENYLVSAAQIDLHKRETLLTVRKFTNKKEVSITHQMHSDAFLYPLSVDDCYIVYMIAIPASPCKVEIRSTETFQLLHYITDESYRLFRYSDGLIITQTFDSPTIKYLIQKHFKLIYEYS
jgi:hypothetical protein